MEADTTHHVCTCEWFKSKQDKVELYPLLVIYSLELVHIDFLTIKNPHSSTEMNVLVITDHFMQHAKAIVTPNQSAKVTAIAFLNEFMVNYGFPENLLTDQGHNFKSQLIKVLCRLAHICKVQTMHYTMASARGSIRCSLT